VKILIINPNTSSEISRIIDSTAKKYAAKETQITTISPPDGPGFIANAYHAALQTPKVLDLIKKNKMRYDYFIIACGGDPGLEASRVLTRRVIGTGEAGIMTACAVARRFCCLAATSEGALALPERLREIGIDRGKCVSVHVVGGGSGKEILEPKTEMLEVCSQIGRKCVEEHGAGALLLLCAGMSGLNARLEQFLKIPVISGVVSAVKIAEQFQS